VIRALRTGEISRENAMKRLEGSRHWVWTVMDPVSILLLVQGSGQIRAKIYAKALLILLQRDRSKIRRVFHTELTCYPPPAQSVAPGARRAFL